MNVNLAPDMVDDCGIQWRQHHYVIISVVYFDVILLCSFVRLYALALREWPENSLKGLV